ncbi:Hypothetical_protein [Hexamita inflata]|uniref:Hypothetical_protein n=1 Tax=Hexamita inflata TaxID=28002 RepID=A0AA86N6Q8_9EUKA|nr:Hypothetical protein HINF_LOCUS1569 [Hexamita inflata]CAI9913925.1 Hypothetical protein HINF_LOCUS1570 [Hexamita inflata]CAI9913926.1 Hypothetical protein HINF_LOCUS1571 [Hexamita inflata]CAI9939465.1 Hypothetical protein HINF_LOCUS27110 [Hexamita inflata]CAI9939466.1 Hypothetical protein HINF_LOCUS27111 [Hexamita inflata]
MIYSTVTQVIRKPNPSYLTFQLKTRRNFRKLIHDYIQLQSLDEQNSLSTERNLASLQILPLNQLLSALGKGAQHLNVTTQSTSRIAYGARHLGALWLIYTPQTGIIKDVDTTLQHMVF